MTSERRFRVAARIGSAAVALVLGGGTATAETISGPGGGGRDPRHRRRHAAPCAPRSGSGSTSSSVPGSAASTRPSSTASATARRRWPRPPATRLANVVGAGKVRLRQIENDKYAGRVLADVVTDDGTDLKEAMLESGLARPYDGGGRDAVVRRRQPRRLRRRPASALDPRRQAHIFSRGDTGCSSSGGLR